MRTMFLLALLPMAHAAASWYTALAPNGRMYYYNDAGKTTWERPSELLGSVVPQPKRTEGDEAAFEDYPIGYISPVRKSPPRKSVGQEWRELFSSIGDTLKQMREAKPDGRQCWWRRRRCSAASTAWPWPCCRPM